MIRLKLLNAEMVITRKSEIDPNETDKDKILLTFKSGETLFGLELIPAEAQGIAFTLEKFVTG